MHLCKDCGHNPVNTAGQRCPDCRTVFLAANKNTQVRAEARAPAPVLICTDASCGEGPFTSVEARRRHEATAHGSKRTAAKAEPKRFECQEPGCKAHYAYHQGLNRHRRKVHGIILPQGRAKKGEVKQPIGVLPPVPAVLEKTTPPKLPNSPVMLVYELRITTTMNPEQWVDLDQRLQLEMDLMFGKLAPPVVTRVSERDLLDRMRSFPEDSVYRARYGYTNKPTQEP